MSRPTPDKRIREEAADWFARLNARTVSVADLEGFRDWRTDPAHREAYEAVESAWRGAGALRDDPDIQAALAQAVVKPRRPFRLRPIWAVAAAAAVALVFGGLWLGMRPQTFTTDTGERRVVRLADGSQLHLDTASAVTARVGGDRRELVLLRGQALFEVAHDAERPFTVTAGEVRVTATGTRFDVRREAGRVRVILVEGGVTVRTEEGRAWRLAPGEQITAAPGSALDVEPTPVDARAATRWTEGRLEFDRVPLRAALSEVNRYEVQALSLAPGVDPDLPISGAFDAGHGLAFAEAVARLHGLRVRSADGGVRLEPGPDENS